jgi:MFS family permease
MRYGRRTLMIGVISAWLVGLALLLAPPLALILIGLSVCAGCGMLCQATSTGYVTASVHEGRSSAIGLYVSSFYIGGSVGGLAAGVLWSEAGWWAVVALSATMVAMMGLIVTFVWSVKPVPANVRFDKADRRPLRAGGEPPDAASDPPQPAASPGSAHVQAGVGGATFEVCPVPSTRAWRRKRRGRDMPGPQT